MLTIIEFKSLFLLPTHDIIPTALEKPITVASLPLTQSTMFILNNSFEFSGAYIFDTIPPISFPH